MPALRKTKTLELYDLDGTFNDFDVQAVLDGKGGSPEVVAYLEASARFVRKGVSQLSEEEIHHGIKKAMRQGVLPNRSKTKYWGTFPDTNKNRIPICPAVDHYLLTPHAVRLYLEEKREESRVLQTRIDAFLKDDSWIYPLYKFCSAESLDHAAIDDDARKVLEARLIRRAFVTIFTNSSPKKACTLLKKAGFGDYIKVGGVERGKIGVIGDGRKFQVDPSWQKEGDPRFGDTIDLSEFFDETGAIVDLRRRHFHQVVTGLMASSGASRVWMASDIPELDLYPLANWEEFRPRVAMRINPTSSPESIRATQELLGATIGTRLSDLTGDLEAA